MASNTPIVPVLETEPRWVTDVHGANGDDESVTTVNLQGSLCWGPLPCIGWEARMTGEITSNWVEATWVYLLADGMAVCVYQGQSVLTWPNEPRPPRTLAWFDDPVEALTWLREIGAEFPDAPELSKSQRRAFEWMATVVPDGRQSHKNDSHSRNNSQTCQASSEVIDCTIDVKSKPEATSEKPGISRDQAKLEFATRCGFIFQEHPDWKDARIAREAGRHPATLLRNHYWKSVKMKIIQAQATLKRGFRKSDGSIEAYE